MTTVDQALRLGTHQLSPSSSSPRLDAELLLGHVLGLGRASLLARYSSDVGGEDYNEFHALIERRARGEPVAYITGHKEFYGLDLYITRDVLVPRPETETVVEVCIGLLA